jgi:hypothetical protein
MMRARNFAWPRILRDKLRKIGETRIGDFRGCVVPCSETSFDCRG